MNNEHPQTQPRTLPPADLSAAFGKTPRVDGLGGLRKTAPLTPVAKEQDQADRTPTTVEGQTVAVTVYVPPSLRERLVDERRHRAAEGDPVTNASIALGAIEVAADRLDQLLRPAEPPAAGGGLFTTRPPHPPVGDVTVQLGLRINRTDKATLDQLAEMHSGGDKSRLVTAALRDRYERNP